MSLIPWECGKENIVVFFHGTAWALFYEGLGDASLREIQQWSLAGDWERRWLMETRRFCL